jgi:pimeloyl-ACP methyl ester carboxylesterase
MTETTAAGAHPAEGAAAAEDTSIRPFRVSIPEVDLVDLRRRNTAARWPTKELVPDQSQVENVYPNLIYFNKVDKGGHFAAWEEPELFSSELRAAFRSLR